MWTKAEDLRAGDVVRTRLEYLDGEVSDAYHLITERPSSEGRIRGIVGADVVNPSDPDGRVYATEWEASETVWVLGDKERQARGWPLLAETCPHPQQERVYMAYPDRVMGGVLIQGRNSTQCGVCGHTLR